MQARTKLRVIRDESDSPQPARTPGRRQPFTPPARDVPHHSGNDVHTAGSTKPTGPPDQPGPPEPTPPKDSYSLAELIDGGGECLTLEQLLEGTESELRLERLKKALQAECGFFTPNSILMEHEIRHKRLYCAVLTETPAGTPTTTTPAAWGSPPAGHPATKVPGRAIISVHVLALDPDGNAVLQDTSPSLPVKADDHKDLMRNAKLAMKQLVLPIMDHLMRQDCPDRNRPKNIWDRSRCQCQNR